MIRILVCFLCLICVASQPAVAAEDKPSISNQPATGSPPAGAVKITTLSVSPAPPAEGDAAPRATHGSWLLRCQPGPEGTGEQCALVQSVVAKTPANVGLSAIVLKTADKRDMMLRVLAPSGILLTPGLGLKIDQGDVGRTGFVRCLPNGCVAEVVLDQSTLDKLKAGKTATFIIFRNADEGFAIPISLAGFTKGVAALP